MSDKKNTIDLSEKLRRGLELYERRLLERTARRGGSLCVSTKDGQVMKVPAEELLKQYNEKMGESREEVKSI